MSVPIELKGTHDGCGGTVVFRPATYRRELLAGQAAPLVAVCGRCGEQVSVTYSLRSGPVVDAGSEVEFERQIEEQPAAVHLHVAAGAENWQSGGQSGAGGRYEGSASPGGAHARGVLSGPEIHAPVDRGAASSIAELPGVEEWRERSGPSRLLRAMPDLETEAEVSGEPAAFRADGGRSIGEGEDAYLQQFAHRFAAARDAVRRVRDELPDLLTADSEWSRPRLTVNLDDLAAARDEAAAAREEAVARAATAESTASIGDVAPAVGEAVLAADDPNPWPDAHGQGHATTSQPEDDFWSTPPAAAQISHTDLPATVAEQVVGAAPAVEPVMAVVNQHIAQPADTSLGLPAPAGAPVSMDAPFPAGHDPVPGPDMTGMTAEQASLSQLPPPVGLSPVPIDLVSGDASVPAAGATPYTALVAAPAPQQAGSYADEHDMADLLSLPVGYEAATSRGFNWEGDDEPKRGGRRRFRGRKQPAIEAAGMPVSSYVGHDDDSIGRSTSLPRSTVVLLCILVVAVCGAGAYYVTTGVLGGKDPAPASGANSATTTPSSTVGAEVDSSGVASTGTTDGTAASEKPSQPVDTKKLNTGDAAADTAAKPAPDPSADPFG